MLGAASVTAQPAAGQGVHVRRYDLSGKATLFISVPSDWKQEIRHAKSASPTIVFAPPTGSSFQLLITPVPNANPSFWEDPDKLRTVVKEDAWRLLGRLVENEANLVELKGKAALAYSYTLRGKSRAAFPLITVGSLLASDFLVHFSLAHRDSGTSLTAPLEALESLEIKTEPSSPAKAEAGLRVNSGRKTR
jgi:hypothetical protein